MKVQRILSLLLALTLLLTLGACGKKDTEAPAPTAEIEQTPTPESTPAPEAHTHVPVEDEEVAASCQSPGLTAGSHCEICGEILEKQEETPRTEHVYVDGRCILCGEADPDAPEETEEEEGGSTYERGGGIELPEMPA